VRIPDESIEEIRAATDIVELIGAYVPLKKRGKNYTGLCPFHHEKTPSFSVSPEKQMYYCFGCGVGGNAFRFLMDHDKLTFVEAVKALAERAGIPLPEEQNPDRPSEFEGLYDACRRASEYYQDVLLHEVEGKLALEYFRHRGFTDETLRRFQLGYAPNGWDSLVKLAQKDKIDLGAMVKAGLVLQREDGSGHYDRFRGRAIFPIWTASGRTIAFGARKMREDDPLGKYINSPETPIYSKSRNLYGLFHAKEAIRNRGFAVLVEGYADLISVFQAGTQNVVASSGTALTEEQITLVGRYAREITLVYDADSAGSKATIRGVDLVIEQGLDVRVAELPAGEDPDSFVKHHGGEAFEELLKKAISFLDFKVLTFQRTGGMETPEGKTSAVREIVDTLSKIQDELKRGFFIKALAEKYDIYESLLHRELEHRLGRGRSAPRQVVNAPSPAAAVPAEETSRRNLPELTAPERDLLCVMLEQGADMVRYVFAGVRPENFQHPLGRHLAELLRQKAEAGASWDVQTVIDTLAGDASQPLIAQLLLNPHEISPEWSRMGSDIQPSDPYDIAESAIRAMCVREIDDLIHEQHRLMREARARGESVHAFQQQVLTLQAERKEILSSKSSH
jgi:DNA primase